MIEDPVAAALKSIERAEYDSITKFGWDQAGMKVKVYLTSLEGIGSIPKDNIVCEFEANSFDLRIQGLNGKNLRLKVPELQGPISVAECKHNVKSNSITITLQKDKDEWWSDLKPKKTLLEKKPEAQKKKQKEEGDAMGGLMDMMKEMY